jgi:signal transduction histidine kinase
MAHIDRRRMTQCLTNLVDNARKFTAVGGRIAVTMDASPKESHFSVADDGPGVPPDEQERIFRPYYQRSGATGGGGNGVGLGLAIVKGIVERHGGRIVLDSSIGKGCRFHLVIPHAVDALNAKAS